MTTDLKNPTVLPPAPPVAGESYYWRSLSALSDAGVDAAHIEREFPPDITELEIPPVDRRGFLNVMSASLALAGVTLSGCIRKPKEHILPFTRRPENLIPGKPRHYATSMLVGSSVVGMVVESQEGRPTKVEGNELHPMSLGAANSWMQASVLDLYDAQRSREPHQRSGDALSLSTWASFDQQLSTLRQTWTANQGEGLAVLMRWIPSPTFRAALDQFVAAFPKARIFLDDAAFPTSSRRGHAMALGAAHRVHLSCDRAKVIVALDADILHTESDGLAHARHFADGRRMKHADESMNRLYSVGPILSTTARSADHHLPLAASSVGHFVVALAAALRELGLNLPSFPLTENSALGRWPKVIAKDLLANQGASILAVGDRQPAWVHALAAVINQALQNIGKTVHLAPCPESKFETLAQLTTAVTQKNVKTLVVIGANPAYEAPADLNFPTVLKQIETVIHHGSHLDETAQHAHWHLPASHPLECWGDWEATDGTLTIQQPLIAPLFSSISAVELLARLTSGTAKDGYELVKANWTARLGTSVDFALRWNKWLHDGIIDLERQPAADPAGLAINSEAVAQGVAAGNGTKAPTPTSLEANFLIDPSLLDGRFCNNGWLQELPDPLTKLTWDNAALMGPVTAAKYSLDTGDRIELALGLTKIELPVFVTPGIAAHVVMLPLGYGRTRAGDVGNGVGFAVSALRASTSPWIVPNVSLRKIGDGYQFASTQEYGQMEEPTLMGVKGKTRALVREATLEQYRAKPDFVNDSELIPVDEIKTHLFKESHAWLNEDAPKAQQWGMSIDLNSCIGCGACTIACQSENNIPIVGKKPILNGRELHWIRVDRYFTGPAEDPRAVSQPVPCMQCENAPCETVCPVAATAHSPEGLNDMAYNRCIGTRYCSNNCPYKVRRFNYFNFTKENDEQNSLLAMQRNPNVTVRFRGVMEKCTYCVQRINEAKIATKVAGSDVVRDGVIQPACAQTCPTQAITFGDITDASSVVAQQKKDPRTYALLADLNARPRTTYLARLRNPNPELL